jgi:hypothetical protein
VRCVAFRASGAAGITSLWRPSVLLPQHGHRAHLSHIGACVEGLLSSTPKRINAGNWFVFFEKFHLTNLKASFENLVTFREPELPDFVWAQKMRLKKCSS